MNKLIKLISQISRYFCGIFMQICFLLFFIIGGAFMILLDTFTSEEQDDEF